MVQRILSSMDSDEVNSINDTTEALQVAYVVQQVYNDMVSGTSFPEQYGFYELIPSNDPLSPTIMRLPSTSRDLTWVRYNSFTGVNPPLWNDISPISLDEMMDKCFSLIPNTNIQFCKVPLTGNLTRNVPIYNDRHPLHYCAVNADTLFFDSFYSSLDDTLQASKTLCYGRQETDFTLSDAFTAPLDEKQFSILLNEAKALAFAELKQASHAKAEKQARKGWINYARTRNNSPSTIRALDRLPNYGRTPNTPNVFSHSRNNGS
jgi:hypothetical protein